MLWVFLLAMLVIGNAGAINLGMLRLCRLLGFSRFRQTSFLSLISLYTRAAKASESEQGKDSEVDKPSPPSRAIASLLSATA